MRAKHKNVELTDGQQQKVEDNMRLVYWVVRQYKHIPPAQYEDVIGQLTYRLCKCVKSFNPDMGIKFSSYAVRSLHGELCNHFRDRIWAIRPPRSLREMTFSEATDRMGDDLSEAELRGHNPQVISSCATPVSLHTLSYDGDEQYRDIPSGEDIEQEVVDKIGGRDIVREVFQSLRMEERVVLALQMRKHSYQVLEERFQVSRADSKQIWEEVRDKVKVVYENILYGDEREESDTNTLRRAVRRSFISETLKP